MFFFEKKLCKLNIQKNLIPFGSSGEELSDGVRVVGRLASNLTSRGVVWDFS